MICLLSYDGGLTVYLLFSCFFICFCKIVMRDDDENVRV